MSNRNFNILFLIGVNKMKVTNAGVAANKVYHNAKPFHKGVEIGCTLPCFFGSRVLFQFLFQRLKSP